MDGKKPNLRGPLGRTLSFLFSGARALTAFLVFGLPRAQAADLREFTDAKISGYLALYEDVKKPGDLTRLPLSKKNRQTLLEEIRNKRFELERATLEQKSDTRFDMRFQDSDVSLDFRELQKGVVYVNAKKIELKPSKSYFVYRTEVSAALATKTSVYNVIVGDYAYAQSKSHRDTVAATLSSWSQWAKSAWENTTGWTPESNIKEFYDARAEFWDRANEQATEGGSFFSNEEAIFDAPTFECKAGKLSSVTNYIHVMDGKLISRKGLTLSADADGRVAKEKSPALSAFAKLASACCARSACEKNAKDHLGSLINSYLEPTAAGTPAARSGSRSSK